MALAPGVPGPSPAPGLPGPPPGSGVPGLRTLTGVRIVADARLLRGGGIGRFLRETTGRWLADPRVDAIRFLGRPDELRAWLDGLPGEARSRAEVVRFPHAPYSPRAQLAWGLRARTLRDGADVAFFPHYDAPLLRHPLPSVIVVHDLTQYLLPECFPWAKRIAGRLLLDGALTRASRVVTVSERSRRDLVEWDHELEAKLDVVRPGVSETFRPPEPEAESGGVEGGADGMEGAADGVEGGADGTGRWRALAPYLLALGPPRPHKNLGLAVDVLAGLAGRRPRLRLVIAGMPEGEGGKLRRRARERGVGDRLTLLGRLDDAGLRAAYGHAAVFVFPSRYEGFGLPPLEAAACGAPVVASAVGALPEVLGGTVPLLDPDRPEAWVEAVDRALDDAQRGEGRRRARRAPPELPAWEGCARELLGIVAEAAAAG